MLPYINLAGQNYHYLWSKPKTRGVSTALVFIHGAGGNHRHWLPQLAPLGRTYEVLTVDLPGHGLSGGRPQSRIENYTDFVYEITGKVLKLPFVLVGHSMGGAIAMDFALRYPWGLAGLILVATGAKLKVDPEIIKIFGAGERTDKLVKLAYHQHSPPEMLNLARQELFNTEPGVYYTDLTACNRFNVISELGQINAPTLVIGAAGDRLTPAKFSRWLGEGISQAHVEIIPSAGHMVMLEQPKLVNEAITRFMDNIKHDKY